MSDQHSQQLIWRELKPSVRQEILSFLKVSEHPMGRQRDVTDALLASLALKLSISKHRN